MLWQERTRRLHTPGRSYSQTLHLGVSRRRFDCHGTGTPQRSDPPVITKETHEGRTVRTHETYVTSQRRGVVGGLRPWHGRRKYLFLCPNRSDSKRVIVSVVVPCHLYASLQTPFKRSTGDTTDGPNITLMCYQKTSNSTPMESYFILGLYKTFTVMSVIKTYK